MNHKTRIIVFIIAAVFVTALIFHSADLAWMIFPFIMYLILGVVKAPVSEKVKLQAERELSKNKSDNSITVDVNVSLQNLGKDTLYLKIEDEPQPEMEITKGSLSRWAALKEGETTTLNYQFLSKRGNFNWNNLEITASDPLGVVENRLKLPAKGETQIRPQIKKYKPFQVHPHGTIHSPGSIPARLGGRGTNFWGVREYHPGDSLRWLDWRLTARHPHQFFTKEFEQEEIAEIGIILDARKKVELRRKGEESLFEHGVGAASSLAEMFLHQGNKVSLLVFGEKTMRVFPGYGKQQLWKIMDCLAKVSISSEAKSLDSMDFLPVSMFPSHSLIIVISPLSSSDWTFFPRLRGSGYQVLLISPDPIHFCHPTLTENPINEMAVRVASIERQIKLRDIANLQIGVINWHIEEPIMPLVRNAFLRVRGHQL